MPNIMKVYVQFNSVIACYVSTFGETFTKCADVIPYFEIFMYILRFFWDSQISAFMRGTT